MFRIKLKEAREGAGYTQKGLSKALGLSDGAVGNWEAGSREPDLKTINKIASVLNVKVSDLVDNAATLPISPQKENPLPLDDDSREALEKFEKLSDRNKQKALGYLDSLSEK